MCNGNYPEAETWIKKYSEIAGKDEQIEKIIQSLHQVNALYEDSTNYLIQKLSINSPNSDCSPVIYKDGIVFVSSRNKVSIVQRKHEWTGLPFFSLYFAKGKDNNFSDPEDFAPSIQTKLNNGTVCFNKEFDELYMTKNNTEDKKILKSDSGIIKLKIYHYL